MITHYCYPYYWYSNCLIFGHWEPFLTGMSAVFVNCLAFWYNKIFIWISCSRLPTSLVLYIACANSGISHFSEETKLLLVGSVIIWPNPGGRHILCYWVLFRPIQWTVLENIYYSFLKINFIMCLNQYFPLKIQNMGFLFKLYSYVFSVPHGVKWEANLNLHPSPPTHTGISVSPEPFAE